MIVQVGKRKMCAPSTAVQYFVSNTLSNPTAR